MKNIFKILLGALTVSLVSCTDAQSKSEPFPHYKKCIKLMTELMHASNKLADVTIAHTSDAALKGKSPEQRSKMLRDGISKSKEISDKNTKIVLEFKEKGCSKLDTDLTEEQKLSDPEFVKLAQLVQKTEARLAKLKAQGD